MLVDNKSVETNEGRKDQAAQKECNYGDTYIKVIRT